MNAVVSTALGSAPTMASPALNSLVGSLTAKVTVIGTKCSISAEAAPSDTDRAVLIGRREDLRAGLAGAGPDTVARIIAPLLMWYASKPLDEAERRSVIRMYQQALGNYPRWAIEQAVGAFNQGRLKGSTEFAPKPATLAQACGEIVHGFQLEQHRIRQILEAEVYREPTPEERARVVERWENEIKPQMLAKTTGAQKATNTAPPLDLKDVEGIRERVKQAAMGSSVFAGPDEGQDGQA